MFIEKSPCVYRRIAALTAVMMVAALVLAACGGDSKKSGAQIDWKPGTPPAPALAALTPAADQAAAAPTAITTAVPAAAQTQETTTTESAPPATPDQQSAASQTEHSGEPLSEAQLKKLQPNELGVVPVLEYHNFTTDPKEKNQYTRSIDEFKKDLGWLYDHDFYVIPLRDLFLDQISAPAGKHPVALTFDDSTVGQFRYLVQADGSLKIDPNSAVGVMEAFYAEHPDFGRGGWFGVLPKGCFDWQGTKPVEKDQVDLCDDKLKFLLANGYEIGDHTLNHKDLLHVDDATFKKEVGGGILALKKIVPDADIDILAMPLGNYPDNGKNKAQMDMLANGFTYEGEQIKLLGCLMVGADPAVPPVSTDWDPVWVPRIQAFDTVDEYGSSAFWFAAFESNPARLYTSDGNPNTITLPDQLPQMLDGTFNREVAASTGKQVITYNATTGVVG
jgi:peptidoglycan/xylan/chitin deacetylase (PgdA/CDA1 family)